MLSFRSKTQRRAFPFFLTLLVGCYASHYPESSSEEDPQTYELVALTHLELQLQVDRIHSGAVQESFILPRDSLDAYALAVSPEGRYAIINQWTGTFPRQAENGWVLDLETGEQQAIDFERGALAEAVVGLPWTFRRDRPGLLLPTGTSDSYVLVDFADVRRPRRVSYDGCHVVDQHWEAEGGVLVACGAEARIVDPVTGSVRSSTWVGPLESVHSFAADNRLIAWDNATSTLVVRNLDGSIHVETDGFAGPRTPRGGRVALLQSRGGTGAVFDTRTGEEEVFTDCTPDTFIGNSVLGCGPHAGPCVYLGCSDENTVHLGSNRTFPITNPPFIPAITFSRDGVRALVEFPTGRSSLSSFETYDYAHFRAASGAELAQPIPRRQNTTRVVWRYAP